MNERRDATPADQRAAPTPVADAQRVPVERGDIQSDPAVPPAQKQPAQTQSAQPRPQNGDIELLPGDMLNGFRGRWERVQVMFVDQPRDAVQQAHDLVDELVDRLTQSFREQREGLMGTWTRGEDVSTEDLRLALQRYRSLFNRLLST
jgi:hypothetical protein